MGDIIARVKEGLKDKIIEWYEHSPKRVYFSIPPQDNVAVAGVLFKDFGFRFCTASAPGTTERSRFDSSTGNSGSTSGPARGRSWAHSHAFRDHPAARESTVRSSAC